MLLRFLPENWKNEAAPKAVTSSDVTIGTPPPTLLSHITYDAAIQQYPTCCYRKVPHMLLLPNLILSYDHYSALHSSLSLAETSSCFFHHCVSHSSLVSSLIAIQTVSLPLLNCRIGAASSLLLWLNNRGWIHILRPSRDNSTRLHGAECVDAHRVMHVRAAVAAVQCFLLALDLRKGHSGNTRQTKHLQPVAHCHRTFPIAVLHWNDAMERSEIILQQIKIQLIAVLFLFLRCLVRVDEEILVSLQPSLSTEEGLETTRRQFTFVFVIPFLRFDTVVEALARKQNSAFVGETIVLPFETKANIHEARLIIFELLQYFVALTEESSMEHRLVTVQGFVAVLAVSLECITIGDITHTQWFQDVVRHIVNHNNNMLLAAAKTVLVPVVARLHNVVVGGNSTTEGGDVRLIHFNA
mmetsp:Transcript_6436/g.18133  ORF Transcript_6436/g.18133 Transcript_6436/m.18133 type:complete len:412 (-) Transcript_6436:773-2008(-)